jgi:hypothetical protein
MWWANDDSLCHSLQTIYKILLKSNEGFEENLIMKEWQSICIKYDYDKSKTELNFRLSWQRECVL